MNSRLVLKFARVWWAGVKVFCRWCAFYIVLAALALPVMGLMALAGERAGSLLGIVLIVLAVVVVPIMFYLTSKYLHLLGDNDTECQRREQSPPNASNSWDRPIMKTSTLIVLLAVAPFVFLLASAILIPSPDAAAQIAMTIMMTVVCGVLALIVSRFKSFGQSPQSIKKLIIVLVCLLSITTAYSVMSFLNDLHRSGSGNRSSVSSFEGAAFSFANLFVVYSLGSEGVGVVCSVASPQRFTSAGPDGPCKVTFADGKSVEFNIIRNQIGWIDQQHRVTFLGPVLNKEDLSLMRSRGDRMKLTISSPDELLAAVKNLKAEQAASPAPVPEAAN